MLRFGLRCKERIGVGVVQNDGTLRIVVDCQKPNQQFMAPLGVRLCSAAGFGELFVEEGEKLWYSAVEV